MKKVRDDFSKVFWLLIIIKRKRSINDFQKIKKEKKKKDSLMHNGGMGNI